MRRDLVSARPTGVFQLFRITSHLLISLTVSVLLVACGGGGDAAPTAISAAPPTTAPTSPPTPTPALVAGPGLGSPIDGVGGAATCGGETAIGPITFPCCPSDPAKDPAVSSGNCTWLAAHLARVNWGIDLVVPRVSEASMPGVLYSYNGERRRALRYKNAGDALASDPTNSAFVWALSISTLAPQGLKVVSTPRVNSIAVSASLHADGHVGWVVRVFTKDGATWVTVREQVCRGSDGIPTRERDYPASTFDQGYIVKDVPNSAPLMQVQSTTGSSISLGQPYVVNFLVTDAEANLSRLAFSYTVSGATQTVARDLTGGSSAQAFTITPAVAGTVSWSAVATDAAGAQSTITTGSFAVTQLPTTTPPPTTPITVTPSIASVMAPTTVKVGESVVVRVSARDSDGDLSSVRTTWSDGRNGETIVVSGTSDTATFTRAFSSAGSFTWTITVRDARNAAVSRSRADICPLTIERHPLWTTAL